MSSSVRPPGNVVVLGASGFIGGQICRVLRRLDERAVVGYSSADCDLLRSEPVQQVLREADSSTSVVFCSAITRRVEDSWNAFQKNLAMVRNFLLAARGRPLRSVIYLSSTDVYGMPPRGRPVDEQTRLVPDGFYALSKYCAERLFQIELGGRCPLTILRLPGVYGCRDGGHSVVGAFISRLLRRQPLQISGDGSTCRDYVDVEDVCSVVQHFLRVPRSATVNVATGRSLPIGQIAAIVAHALGQRPRIHFTASRGDRDFDLTFDIGRLRMLYPNWIPKPLEQGIRDYVDGLDCPIVSEQSSPLVSPGSPLE